MAGKLILKMKMKKEKFHTNFNFTNAIRALYFFCKKVLKKRVLKVSLWGDGIL